jgi:hypothetical protein
MKGKLNYFILMCLFIVSCANLRKTSKLNQNKPIKNAKLGDNTVESYPTTINDVRLMDSILVLSIGYTGGCANHNFELVGNEMITKSLPPMRSINLIHTTLDEETCKREILETLYFNIKQLSYRREKESIIKLNLADWKEQIVYTYH